MKLPQEPGWLGVVLGVAGGFLLGVVLLVALGGVVHDRTHVVRHTAIVTQTTTVKVKVVPPRRPGDITVPNVVGVTLDNAEQQLADIGLDDEISGGGAFVFDASSWDVVAQHPRAGTRVDDASIIVLDIEHQ